jgi:hypothetical protein
MPDFEPELVAAAVVKGMDFLVIGKTRDSLLLKYTSDRGGTAVAQIRFENAPDGLRKQHNYEPAKAVAPKLDIASANQWPRRSKPKPMTQSVGIGRPMSPITICGNGAGHRKISSARVLGHAGSNLVIASPELRGKLSGLPYRD